VALVIEQYGRKDDEVEDFLVRIEAAGYNRAHAVSYISWGLICCLMGHGIPSGVPAFRHPIDPEPTGEEVDAFMRSIDQDIAELPLYKLVPCPRDTNGDGDCGQPACPYCHGGDRRRRR
jgi:hypothetical protein